MTTLFTNEERESLRKGEKIRHDLWRFIYKTIAVYVLKFRAEGGWHYAVYVNGQTTNINFNHIEIAAQAGFEFVDGHTTGFKPVHEEMQWEVSTWDNVRPKQ